MADDLRTIRDLVRRSATGQQTGQDLFGRLEAAIRADERRTLDDHDRGGHHDTCRPEDCDRAPGATGPTLDQLRDRAYTWYDRLAEPGGEPVPRAWRVVGTDTESDSGFGPACPSAASHPMLDLDMGRDTAGVYDCCPHVVETFSVDLAAYVVALLNADVRPVAGGGSRD